MALGVWIMAAWDAKQGAKKARAAAKLGPEFGAIVRRLAVKGGTKKFAFRSIRAGLAGTAVGIIFQADEIFDWLVLRGRDGESFALPGGLKTTDETRQVFVDRLERSIFVHPISGSKLLLTNPKRFFQNALDARVDFAKGIGFSGIPALLVGGLEVSAQEYSTLVLPEEVSVPLNKVLDFVL